MRHCNGRIIVVILAASLACAIAAPRSPAATRSVPSGLYPTIQSAINASFNGDVIVVANGTYTGVGNTNIIFGGRQITVQSQNGPEVCIIDGGGVARGFIFSAGETSSAILEGFTITNADTTGSGGAVVCSSSSPTIRNCKITGNEAFLDGGGISFSASNATVVNCTITGNESVFSSGGGLAFTANSSVAVINCTITGNRADNGAGGAFYALDSNPTFTNCILWDNSPDETSLGVSAAPTLNYCDVEGGWGGAGTGNVNADPLFASPGAWVVSTWTDGNYLILSGSPCIDSGFGDNGATVPATDIAGKGRKNDPQAANTGTGTPAYVDMGAYERQAVLDDVLWRDTATGQVLIWLMNGLTLSSSGTPGTVSPAFGWAIKGTGDFDADGNADVVWRSATTGEVSIWLMNGLTPSATGSAGTVDPASAWAIKGVGDFDADGKTDILWRNATTGELSIWFMNGLTPSATGSAGTVSPQLGWSIKGVGDFDADGKADILWRNDMSGQLSIWLMNGLTISASGALLTIPIDWGWSIKGVGDFDGDGKADILWRNTVTGQLSIWFMNGIALASSGSAGTVASALGWMIEGVGDFDSDGKADILWRNATSGQLSVWLMNGLSLTASGSPLTIPIAWGWTITGTGDFDGDGKTDIVWRNITTGQVSVWLMNGIPIAASADSGTVTQAAGSAIKGVGDFDDDGQDDILWRSPTTGQLAIWLMDGLTVSSSGSAGTVDPSSPQTIKGVGDFNGDGKADILWRNDTTGEVVIWFMNGLTVTSTGSPYTVAIPLGWTIKGVGDFNGDGKADILWRNDLTGQVSVWLMNSTTLTASGSPYTVSIATGWMIKGVGDFDGDGKDDILWRNTATGQLSIWLMNGIPIGTSAGIDTVAPALRWAIKGAGDFDGDGKDDILWRNATSGQVSVWLMDGMTLSSSGSPGTVSPTSTLRIKGVGDFNGTDN